MNKYRVIIFDLDGTLLDTAPGIISAVRYTADTMGLPQLPDSTLAAFCGPPSLKSYRTHYGLDEEAARACVTHHRWYQNEYGFKEAVAYIQLVDLLKHLKVTGHQLAVATLKREDIAIRTLEAAGIAHYFDAICGIDQAESKTKADIITDALTTLDRTPWDAVLIGDSEYDAQGAWSAGIPFIAVTYGYGFKTPEDTKAYHPLFTASDVQDLLTFFAAGNE